MTFLNLKCWNKIFILLIICFPFSGKGDLEETPRSSNFDFPLTIIFSESGPSQTSLITLYEIEARISQEIDKYLKIRKHNQGIYHFIQSEKDRLLGDENLNHQLRNEALEAVTSELLGPLLGRLVRGGTIKQVGSPESILRIDFSIQLWGGVTISLSSDQLSHIPEPFASHKKLIEFINSVESTKLAKIFSTKTLFEGAYLGWNYGTSREASYFANLLFNEDEKCLYLEPLWITLILVNFEQVQIQRLKEKLSRISDNILEVERNLKNKSYESIEKETTAFFEAERNISTSLENLKEQLKQVRYRIYQQSVGSQNNPFLSVKPVTTEMLVQQEIALIKAREEVVYEFFVHNFVDPEKATFLFEQARNFFIDLTVEEIKLLLSTVPVTNDLNFILEQIKRKAKELRMSRTPDLKFALRLRKKMFDHERKIK